MLCQGVGMQFLMASDRGLRTALIAASKFVVLAVIFAKVQGIIGIPVLASLWRDICC